MENMLTAKEKAERQIKKGEIVNKILKWALIVFTWFYCFTLIVPIYWLVINALKTNVDYYLNESFSFPTQLAFDNFTYFLENMEVTRYVGGRITYTLPELFLTSVIYAAYPCFVNLTLTACCAYALGRYRFFGSEFLHNLGIVLMIIPGLSSGASTIVLYRALGIYDNLFMYGITAASCAFMGFNYLMFRGIFKGIPKEYEEAVLIDGGGYWRVFITIMIPMVLPTFGALWIMGFISAWNDYTTFMTMLPSYANIAYGMYMFENNVALSDGIITPQILAGLVVVSIPSVLLFLVNQKAITERFQVGGLKG